MKRLLTIILLSVLIAAPAGAQLYLGVIKGEAKKIPIAVLDVSDETGSPSLRALAMDVLQADLRRSQIFEVMDPKKLDLSYSGKEEPKADFARAGTSRSPARSMTP